MEEGKELPFSSIYQISEIDLEMLREYINKNLKKGFIRLSSLLAGNPVLFILKKDEKKRLCIDYWKLNVITIKNRYILPLVNELRNRLSETKVFTKLDLYRVYNLIRIKKDKEWKTVFRYRYGHFKYQIILFGLINIPAIYIRIINNIL